jgi:transposase
MQRLQAYKFELKPNGEQQRNMRRFAGSCRFVFNKALALQKERHEQGEKKLGYAALCRRLTEWKAQQETLWLSDTPGQALQQALKNLERAYKNFFARRADFPRLPAQDHDHDQPKPRDGVHRGLAGAEYVKVGSRHGRCTGQKRSGQVRPEQIHPRSGLVRVQASAGLQAGMERRLAHRRFAAEHEPHLSVL